MISKGFGSDNHSGVHPEILNSMVAANAGHAPSYGTDDLTHQAIQLFKDHFGSHIDVFFVFNGTAANALAMRSMVKPYQSILCSDVSHLNVDECGAPEFFAGAKLITIPSQDGKIQIDQLKSALIRKGDQHFSQVKGISLTQPTELGTCYSVQEIKEITNWAHQEGLFVHIDGARLCNAAFHLEVSLKQLTSDLKIDVLSFGGTKNGLMMGEALVFFNKTLAQDFQYIRKQSAQLPSKTRFISAAFCKYLQDNLFSKIAKHSCEMAQYLFEQLQNVPEIEITVPRQSNAVFAKIPKAWIKPLREKHFFYVWDEKTFVCRLMCSWDTEKAEIDSFIHLARSLKNSSPKL